MHPPVSAAVQLQQPWQHPELPERLRSLSLYARKGLTERGLTIRPSALEAPTPIIPIYTYETYRTLHAAAEIYDRGVYVNPPLPPVQIPSRSRIENQVIAVTRSGQRSVAPPGKRCCGRLAIRSKRSCWPAVASAISFPASVAIATPWPE